MSIEQLVQRVSQLDKFIIQHAAWSKAFSGIQECVVKSAAYRDSMGCLLLAEGGLGKTTVCRAIMHQMPLSNRVEQRIEKTIIPAFYAEIPSPATIKSVAANLLAKLHDPNHLAGTTAHMTARLVRLLAECETRLVFLDEFHHLFDIQKTTTHVNTQVCNWIKSLVNATNVTFCLVGLPKFAPILSIDSQLARRFPLQFELGPLHPGNAQMQGSLLPFLAQLKWQLLERLQLQAVPQMDRVDVAVQIFAATSGNPAFIMSLVKEAVLCALRMNASELTLDNFATAWDTGLTAKVSLCSENPFRMSPGQLAGAFRRDV